MTDRVERPINLICNSSLASCSNKKPRLVFVVNELGFLISHRWPIVLSAEQAGFQVSIVYGTARPNEIRKCVASQIESHRVPMSRRSRNPLAEVRLIYALVKLFRQLNPTIVHLVTIKPYLYGGIAARLTKVPAVVSAVAGLGSLVSNNSMQQRVLRYALKPLYLYAFGHQRQKIIVQNRDDLEALQSWGVLDPGKATLIPGSGVDLTSFTPEPERQGPVTVVLASRLLKEKGILDYVEAARRVRRKGYHARFWLVGTRDPGNPSSLTQEELDDIRADGIVELLGYKENVAEVYSQAHIVCLPSYYGEGLPKALIEAAASGRAIVTTNHPGCRDAIIPEETGLLVRVRDPEQISDKITYLIDNPAVRKRFGEAGRKLAEREFSIARIIENHIQLYEELL